MSSTQQHQGLDQQPRQQDEGAPESKGPVGASSTEQIDPELVQSLPSEEDLLDDADPVGAPVVHIPDNQEDEDGQQSCGEDRHSGQPQRESVEDEPETPLDGEDNPGPASV